MLHLPKPRMRLRRGRRAPSRPHGLNLVHDEIAAELPDEDLAEDLPDEDLAEDLLDTLDLYRSGSKPRCEEAEYRDLIQDAVDRLAREG